MTSTPHMCRRALIKSIRKWSCPYVRHEVEWKYVGIAPRISNYSARQTWVVCFKTLPLNPQQINSGVCWMVLTAGLDGLENRTIFLPLLGINSRLLVFDHRTLHVPFVALWQASCRILRLCCLLSFYNIPHSFLQCTQYNPDIYNVVMQITNK